MGAPASQTELAGAEAPEPCGLGPTDGIPSADYSGVEPRDNPRHPIFRDHNCWKCREGEKPCVEGNYSCCSYPYARND